MQRKMNCKMKRHEWFIWIKRIYKVWEHNCIAYPLFYLNTEVNCFARLSDRLSVGRQHACSTQRTNFRNGIITHAIRSRHAVTFAMETTNPVFCLFNSPCEDNCRLWKSVANKQRASSSQAWVNITPSYGWYCLFVACEINRVGRFLSCNSRNATLVCYLTFLTSFCCLPETSDETCFIYMIPGVIYSATLIVSWRKLLYMSFKSWSRKFTLVFKTRRGELEHVYDNSFMFYVQRNMKQDHYRKLS